jgi:predicted ABC-type ATPase
VKISLSEAGPRLVAIARPNGAGKTTFYRSYLRDAALAFVNADVIAAGTGIGAYAAAEMAEAVRRELFEKRESFIFETVFSDPAGAKLGFLREAVSAGYAVVLCFVGVSSARVSEDRVAVRVMQGGHDVPTGKILERYPRVMENLRLAMLTLPLVLVYDNDDIRDPHRLVAATRGGVVVELAERVPEWLAPLLP